MILSVDGGATKTVALVFDEYKLKLKGLGISGPSNLSSVGPNLASDNISIAVNEALDNAGIKMDNIKAGLFGIAGIGDSHELTLLGIRIVDNITGRTDFIKVNDGIPAYMLANLNTDGIVFAGGTGSVAYYSIGGKLDRIGGWGWFVGDEGSASWMSKRALNLATKEYDGLLDGKLLVTAAEEYFGNEFKEIIAFLEQNQDKRKISGFASKVSELARNGYPNAIKIMEESADYVRKILQVASTKFSTEPKVSLVGGTMLAGDMYVRMITESFSQRIEVFFGYHVGIGGLLILMEKIGLQVDSEIRDDLVKQMDTILHGYNRQKYEKFLNTKL